MQCSQIAAASSFLSCRVWLVLHVNVSRAVLFVMFVSSHKSKTSATSRLSDASGKMNEGLPISPHGAVVDSTYLKFS